MPEQVINFTPAEWGQAQKRKAKKLRDSLFLAYVLATIAGCGLYQLLKGMVYR